MAPSRDEGRRLCRRRLIRGALAVSAAVLLEPARSLAATESRTVEAGFRARSYAPDAMAELWLSTRARRVTLQLVQPGGSGVRARSAIGGVPLTRAAGPRLGGRERH